MWAGISMKGPTPILIFTGNMNSEFYQTILRNYLLPFTDLNFPNGYWLIKDNDPKHVSKSTKTFMEQNNINWWPTPPESPDINIIENVWHALKYMYHLRLRVKPSNQAELIDGIKQFWISLTPEKCRNYITHVHKVLPVVVEKWGDVSGF